MRKMPTWKRPKHFSKALEDGDGVWEDERWSPILLTAMSGTELDGREIPIAWQILFEPSDDDFDAVNSKLAEIGIEPDGYGWGEYIQNAIRRLNPGLAKRLHTGDCEMATCVLWVESEEDCRALLEVTWNLIFSMETRAAGGRGRLRSSGADHQKTLGTNAGRDVSNSQPSGMRVHFSQGYIEPAAFPFSHLFQHRLSREVTALVEPSAEFQKRHGADFDLVFNVSAKQKIRDNEIRGPAVYKKDKNVEFTVFLPFDVIMRQSHAPRVALEFLLKGVGDALDKLEIDKSRLLETQGLVIAGICADPTMLEEPSWNEAENKTRVRRVFTAFFQKHRT